MKKERWYCWQDKVFFSKANRLSVKKIKLIKKLEKINAKIEKLEKSPLNWRNAKIEDVWN